MFVSFCKASIIHIHVYAIVHAQGKQGCAHMHAYSEMVFAFVPVTRALTTSGGVNMYMHVALPRFDTKMPNGPCNISGSYMKKEYGYHALYAGQYAT